MKPECNQNRRGVAPTEQFKLKEVSAPPNHRAEPSTKLLTLKDLRSGKQNKSRDPLTVIVELTPGQIPNIEQLAETGRAVQLGIKYAAGMSKFSIQEEYEQGWGRYPFRVEGEKASGQSPFTVDITLPVSEQGNRNDRGEIVMGNYGTLELGSSSCPDDGLSHTLGQFDVAEEFRTVLKEAYAIRYDEDCRAAGVTTHRDPRQPTTNFEVNSVPKHHNPDFYGNGIVLHTGAIRDLNMVDRARIFQAALTAYFTAKGYQTEVVDLIDKGQLVKTM